MLFGPSHGAAYAAAGKAYGLDHLAGSQAELAQAYAAHDHTIRNVLARVQGDLVRDLPQTRRAAILAVLDHNYSDRAAGQTLELPVNEDSRPGYVQDFSGKGTLR